MSVKKRSKKSSPFIITALKLMLKISLLLLNALIAIASDERRKPRYTVEKAEELYEDDVITGTKFEKCIHGDH